MSTEPLITIEAAADLDKSFARSLKRAGKLVSDLTVPLRLIQASWFRSNNAIFALKGPGKYQDLSEKYKVVKQRQVGFVYPILLRKGRLKGSLTDPKHPDAIGELEDKLTLKLGTKVPYSVFHSSKEPRTIMPYRPTVFAGAEQTAPSEINKRIDAWMKIIDSWVEQVTGAK